MKYPIFTNQKDLRVLIENNKGDFIASMKELEISEDISMALIDFEYTRAIDSGFDGVYYLVINAMKNVGISKDEIKKFDDFEITPLTIVLGFSDFSSEAFRNFMFNYKSYYLEGEITKDKLIEDFYTLGFNRESINITVPQSKYNMFEDELVKLISEAENVKEITDKFDEINSVEKKEVREALYNMEVNSMFYNMDLHIYGSHNLDEECFELTDANKALIKEWNDIKTSFLESMPDSLKNHIRFEFEIFKENGRSLADEDMKEYPVISVYVDKRLSLLTEESATKMELEMSMMLDAIDENELDEGLNDDDIGDIDMGEKIENLYDFLMSMDESDLNVFYDTSNIDSFAFMQSYHLYNEFDGMDTLDIKDISLCDVVYSTREDKDSPYVRYIVLEFNKLREYINQYILDFAPDIDSVNQLDVDKKTKDYYYYIFSMLDDRLKKNDIIELLSHISDLNWETEALLKIRAVAEGISIEEIIM